MGNTEILKEFCEWFNNASREEIKPLNHHRYYYAVMNSFNDQFMSQSKRDYIGFSQLYKHELLLGLVKLGFSSESSISVKNAVTFHYGDIFEGLIIELMRSQGITIEDEQKTLEVTFNDEAFKGHIDGRFDGTLIEVKTMSNDYFKKFVKEPNDFRGYLTQLGFYYEYLDSVHNAAWLCYNKQTNVLQIVEPDLEQLEAYCKIGLDKARRLSQIKDVRSLLENVNIPAPVPEVFKKEKTGKYMLPYSLRDLTKVVNIFFDTYQEKDGYGKMKTYVKQQKTNEEIITQLEAFQNV
jgi:hypothetical protein